MVTEEENKPEIQIDKIKYAFMKAKEHAYTELDALQNNLTETFWATLRDKIHHKELLNIAVRGEVRTGKSTIVLKIVWELNKYLTKIGYNKEAKDTMYKFIFSDQTEFLRFINGDERNVALAIDEFNRMAQTGLNATTEEALFDFYSDVFAGQYLHRVTASPDVITDKNANIILDVIGKDEVKQVTRCKLIYRDIISKQMMSIGVVDIYIGDIIENWLSKGVRNIVEKKGSITLEEQKLVNTWVAKDWYIKYQVKKYKRMLLLKEHGVRDIRELEFSDIILGALGELEDQAKIKRVPAELVNTVVDEVRRQHKRIYSILAVNDIAQKTRAILGVYTEINSLNKILKARSKTISVDEKLILMKSMKQLQLILEKRIAEQKKLSDLYREYLEIK